MSLPAHLNERREYLSSKKDADTPDTKDTDMDRNTKDTDMYLSDEHPRHKKKSVRRAWITRKMLWPRAFTKQIILTSYAWHLISVATAQRAIDSLHLWEA